MQNIPKKYEVQHLVATNDLKGAIHMIIGMIRRLHLPRANEAILLSRELYELKEISVRGTLNYEQLRQRKSDLASRLLELLDLTFDALPLMETELTIEPKKKCA